MLDSLIKTICCKITSSKFQRLKLDASFQKATCLQKKYIIMSKELLQEDTYIQLFNFKSQYFENENLCF